VKHLLVFLALVLAAGAIAGSARADGDPASDYLIGQQVFFPFSASFPAEQKAQLSALVQEANRKGFKIRVAVIESSYDMGSVTALYGRPRIYARFLGEELSFVYKQRLLIVMRKGFGFNWPGHAAAPAYAVLAHIAVKSDPTGMLETAETAVERLAAADGVVVSPPAHVNVRGPGNSNVRLLIIVGVAALLILAAAATFALRRRRR
jgi:hypothetical protein